MVSLVSLDQDILNKVALTGAQASSLADSVSDFTGVAAGSQVGLIFPTEQLEEFIEQIEFSSEDCEVITTEIETKIQMIIDAIKDKLNLADSMSPFPDLMNIPTSPDDLIDWVKDFVASYISPQIKALIDVVIQIFQFIALLAKVLSAVQQAITNMQLCLIAGINDALNNVQSFINEKIAEATSGITDILQTINSYQTQLVGITGGEAPLNTSSVSALIESIDNGALDVLDNQTKEYRDSKTPYPTITDLVTNGNITNANFPTAISVSAGGTGYSNNATITLISSTGTSASLSVVTTANVVTSVAISDPGTNYAFTDRGYVNTTSGSGAVLNVGLDKLSYGVGKITIYGSQAEWLASL